MALLGDGTQVIPIYLEHPGYREWELTRDGIEYLIINKDGADRDWRLYQWVQDGWAKEWREIGVGTEVDAFLRSCCKNRSAPNRRAC
jgi:hypothetical protein